MDDIEVKILIGLSRTVNSIHRKTGKLCTKYNITLSQFGVLEALYNKGDLTVGEIKTLILSSDGTIPVVIKNLEKNNLVKKEISPSDKRCTIVKITKEGEKLIKEVYPKNEEMIKEVMDIWTSQEKNELLRLLKKFGGKDEKNSNKNG